ncbi:polyhomeotic-like protein 1 isoform X2 [Neocloeon triangulifer]|uniref:polyhomeotic-like protein 1 isoform X2 n=1 Tax=Neocloeon triangulifer TaxID=2078957 RepID=UPI00286F86F7|nr:polyhomeotic-like protein 1 isoform X2 [Neocloeon triangulifer]
MNCAEMQKSEGQQQAEMMAMQQQQQQQQSVVTTTGCVVNQPQMQSFQTLQIQHQPPPSSTPMPSPSPVAMQMMPPQQPQMQQFATAEWQGQRIQLVPQQQGPMYVQQVYNAQNGQQYLIPANNMIHHPGQPLQVITTGKPTFQPGPMTPQLITPQGKATMVQATTQGGATQCYIPAQQASGNPNQTLLISHMPANQQGTAVMPQPSPTAKQQDQQKGKVIQAQAKPMQQQQNMIVQQQPQQIVTQGIPNQHIINPMQWPTFPSQGTVWAQPAGSMPMNTGISTTSSPIFIRSTQPDGTHVFIQSNAVQQQMQQQQMTTQAQIPQQQQQMKPVAVKPPETVTTQPNIQPKVTTQKTLTIRPSTVQQPIQPASSAATQTSVSLATAKPVQPKVKVRPGRPIGNKIADSQTKQISPQPQLQQQMTQTGQQLMVNKVLLPNNSQPMQIVSTEAPRVATNQTAPLMSKLLSVPQPIQFLPQTITMSQPQKEKAVLPPMMAPVVPMPPVVQTPVLQQGEQTAKEQSNQTAAEDSGKDDLETATTPETMDEDEEDLATDDKSKEKLKALVKPQVLTHVIEGFVIQEAGEPFPTTTTPEEMATCEYCKKTDVRSKFKKSKRFCSSSCAKSHKRQKEDKVGGKKARSAASESSGEELVIDETTTSSANPGSTPSPPAAPNVNPQEWTVKEVCDFIQVLPGCAEYVEDFSMQEIDGQALLLLRADHLMSAMGMKLGPALKICAKIQQLKNGIVDTS